MALARALSRVALLAAALTCAGCTAQAMLGEPLPAVRADGGYRFERIAQARRSDDLLVLMTFSGGGTRASALAYGVLEQMAADRIEHDGARKRILDEIDVISAVSGGSVTAAYFTLHGDRTFVDFRTRFLERDVEGDMWRAMLASPANWWRLGSSRYSRGDLFAEYLDRRLFRGATFGAIESAGDRPYLMINATDLSASGRFEFTQDFFDAVCVDLSNYPIARAVAASSAAPLLVTPLTLANRSGSCGWTPRPWMRSALERDTSDRLRLLAERLNAYQDSGRYRYLHLADGALSDNLGLRPAIDVLSGAEDFQDAQVRLGLRGVQRIVLIMVDAAGKTGEDIARRPTPPDSFELARLAGGSLIDQFAAENRALLREQLERLARSSAGASAPQTYWIEVRLDAIEDAALRERLRSIPTGFDVPRDAVQELVCSGRALLQGAPDYQRLLRDMNGRPTTSPGGC